MKLLGYIRVSTEEQAEHGHSLGIQDDQLHRYCELYGFELVDVIVDDGISAGVDLEKRPGGSELLDRLLDGQADGVAVQRIDRIFRKSIDGLVNAARFNQRGLSIHSVNERIDSSTPDGWLTLSILLATAEYERNKIRQRAVETAAGLREQGRAWGHAPYGCVAVDGRIFRDPDTWAVREQILAMKEDLSYAAIAAQLQADRVPNPSGGRLWHKSTLKGLIESHHDLEHIPYLPAPDETPVSAVDRIDKIFKEAQ